MSIYNKVNQNNCINNGPNLPPVRKARPSSSTERSCLNKVLSSQRKMSLEAPNQHQSQDLLLRTPNKSSGQSRRYEKEKSCSRLNRTFRGDSGVMEISSKVRVKPERQNELVKIMRYNDPYPGDDPLLLEGSMLLEKFDQSIDSIEAKQSSQSWVTLVDCKLKLQRLLLEKIKSIAEEDCITLIQEGHSFVRQIETIYTEDQYKLETACNLINLPEKDRKIALDDFIITSKKRKRLPDETQNRFNSWIDNLNNCQRLLNINYRIPKERLTVLMVEKTAIKLEKIKVTILHWLALTLTINIKIMAIYWDHLPFETLNDVFISCLTFNQIWPTESIDPISILSLTQAEAASTRISFLIQSEAKKITSAKRRADQLNNEEKATTDPVTDKSLMLPALVPKGKKVTTINQSSSSALSSPNHRLKTKIDSGSTSDYYTNSTTSSVSTDKNCILTQSGESIDLASYLSIVLSSSQRIVLKLSFLLQTASNGSTNISPFSSSSNTTIKSRNKINQSSSSLSAPSTAAKSNPTRATWSKIKYSSASNNPILNSSNCYDYLYWPVFWKNFAGQLIDDILFAQNNVLMTSASSPIFFTPKTFQKLVFDSLDSCLKENDFPPEAIKEIKKISNVLNYHLTDQSWFKTYLEIYRINSDRNNQVFGRNENINYVPDAVCLINNLISIVNQEMDYGTFGVYQICSIKQIDSLLRLMITHTSNLSNRKPLKDLIQFFKDIQVLDKGVKSLSLDKQPFSHNEILGLLNNIIEILEEKIINGTQKLALQTFAHRISQQKNAATSINQNEPIIPYVKRLIMEPNLELLADYSRSNHINRLKTRMIAIFAKIIYQIVINDGLNSQIRLTRNLRAILRQEIVDFIRDYDGWFKSNHQQLDEINDLRQLIDESTKSRECSLFKKLNKIYPIPNNWSESQTVNFTDLQRCGCFF
ncbi:uncharacterized protein LOC107360706 isoform X1 [Tetranychus urticae]|uniref:Uncharacterized protein n=2 Tax=Tetranychus urticae TaxID=32264 RepID=T1K4G3_TETUR|nr:uncharacterized protein LOC107360706 isoform X1 [Tetranychus urticae]